MAYRIRLSRSTPSGSDAIVGITKGCPASTKDCMQSSMMKPSGGPSPNMANGKAHALFLRLLSRVARALSNPFA